MKKIEENIGRCYRCELGTSRLNPVPGEGSPQANVIMVGEAPGAKEDKTGKPFVGSAGKVLDEVLTLAGIKREDVFITSILKCRPPGNRNPKAEEIKTCLPWLTKQIEALKPKVICTMGRFATKALAGMDRPITEVHGQFIEKEGMIYFPIYHPAAILYNSKLREGLEADLRKLKAYLEQV